MTNRFINRAKNIISKSRESRAEKTKKTKEFITRLAEMQLFVDKTTEKRNKLYEVIKQKASDCDKTILEKGVILYVERLEAIDIIMDDLYELGIECKKVTSKTTQKGRKEVCEWFKESPENKIVLISACGGESLNLNFTNEMILYNVPKGPGKFSQLIGRVDRGFGKFNKFIIRFIILKGTVDEYSQILLSSRKELEMEILTQDIIPVKKVESFEMSVIKKIRREKLWKFSEVTKMRREQGSKNA